MSEIAHLIERKSLTNSDEVVLECQCGWTYTATNESFVPAIEDRHLRMNTKLK